MCGSGISILWFWSSLYSGRTGDISVVPQGLDVNPGLNFSSTEWICFNGPYFTCWLHNPSCCFSSAASSFVVKWCRSVGNTHMALERHYKLPVIDGFHIWRKKSGGPCGELLLISYYPQSSECSVCFPCRWQWYGFCNKENEARRIRSYWKT